MTQRGERRDFQRIMYIKTETPGTRAIAETWMPDGYVVEFNDDGVARVKREVGERLVEQYEKISEHTPESNE
jgi:hypothetical protein